MNTSGERATQQAQELLDTYLQHPEIAPNTLGYRLDLYLALEPQLGMLRTILAATFTATILLHSVPFINAQLQQGEIPLQLPEVPPAKEIATYMLIAGVVMHVLLEKLLERLRVTIEQKVYEELAVSSETSTDPFYVTALSAEQKRHLNTIRAHELAG